MSEYCVGIDGGGTKTRLLALDSDNPAARFESTGGPCTLSAVTAKQCRNEIVGCVKNAGIDTEGVVSICAAVAGYSFVARRAELTSLLSESFPNAALLLIADFEAAYRNAGHTGCGIHIIAGTGSIAYGESGSVPKRSHRSGGYGYILDDAGSSYGVGRSALAAVLRAIDGTGPKTILTESIATALNAPMGWDDIIGGVYGGEIDRVTVASLARTVSSVAEDGDEVSGQILFRAGGALAKLAEAVYRKVSDPAPEGNGERVCFSRSGSLWLAGAHLCDVFERSVHRFATNASIGAVAEVDAALGALDIAMERHTRA